MRDSNFWQESSIVANVAKNWEFSCPGDNLKKIYSCNLEMFTLWQAFLA